MLTNQERINLIKAKEKSIDKQIKVLLEFKKQMDMKNYRTFNNVFISSVRSLMSIVNSNSQIQIDTTKIVYINGQEETDKNINILTKLNPQIEIFIKAMINDLTEQSNTLLNKDENSESDNIEFVADYSTYKYNQQIVDDYIKLLLYIR